ncbi:MAG: DUF2252 domain-containing protein [Nocardioides sp.]|nr:DUF2252 domain-containing protein [Nocardioides sp.]
MASTGTAGSATNTAATRRKQIIDVLGEAFEPLMRADPASFRAKYRKMARDPHAFYRGTACLFYADVTSEDDPFVDERTASIWIHGDLHAENFGTYMNSDGRLVFDVNDFDEAYVGHWTWDLRRFAASLALIGWQKALPEDDVRRLIGRYLRAYLSQVDAYADTERDDDFALHLDNTDGPVRDALLEARSASRVDLLASMLIRDAEERRFREDPTVRRLGKAEQRRVMKAFEGYLETIPEDKRIDSALFYEVVDIVGKSGFGIGSAGLPAYNVLVEGHSQSLDNDVVLSMKQANVPAVSRFVDSERVASYFDHEGHRTAVSQRALQVHTDPLLGHTTLGGEGYVVAELSPYEKDLSWDDLTEPDDVAGVVGLLGRATAKVHCSADEDSDQDLVELQVEEAVVAVLDGRRRAFVEDVTEFGIRYADRVREDHALFVDAFRAGDIGVSAT